MKRGYKLAFTIGIIGVIFFIFGQLFRILHWELLGFVNGFVLSIFGQVLIFIALLIGGFFRFGTRGGKTPDE